MTTETVVNWKIYLAKLQEERDQIREKIIPLELPIEKIESVKIMQMGRPVVLNTKRKEINKEISERVCLRCDEYFMSASIGNRCCIKCTKVNRHEV